MSGPAPLVSLHEMEQVAQGIDHAEGICMAPDGTVYVSGEKGQIYRLEADGTATELTSTGGWTLGLAADHEGRIYACDAVRRAILRWRPDEQAPIVWSLGPPEAPFVLPNWGAFSPDGSYFVSDSGGWKARDGRVVVVREGHASVWTSESLDFPNGLAVTPDGRSWGVGIDPGRLVAFDIALTAAPAARAHGPAGRRARYLFRHRRLGGISCYRPDVVYRWRRTGASGHREDARGPCWPRPIAPSWGPTVTCRGANIGRWHVTRFRVPGLVGVRSSPHRGRRRMTAEAGMKQAWPW
jgi:hypothetical protein